MQQKTPQQLLGSLITIGEELLLGDVADSNAQFIAAALRAHGFRLRTMITVGDKKEEIVEVLKHYVQTSRFMIITGGLGPTEDDRTNSAVAEAFQLPLAPNREYKERLQNLMARRGLAWSDEIEKMTMLPRDSVKMGTEMAGFLLEYQGVPCYFLPGVPREMRELMQNIVLPDLESRFPGRPVYMKTILRVQGLTESAISGRLKDFSPAEEGIEIGYLPQRCENWVTIFAMAENEERAASKLRKAKRAIAAWIGPENISGEDDECIEKVVGDQLRRRGWRLAVTESCTGGLLSGKITSIPGASDYFERAFITYSNVAKMELLDVPGEDLDRYGAVSAQVARGMAEGARKKAGVDAALSITGIAGPAGGSAEKPVGTVFIGCSTRQGFDMEKHVFRGDREVIQDKASHAALVLLWRILCK